MSKIRSLFARSITGLIYIGIILSCILTDSLEMMAWVFAAMGALGVYEYQTMVGSNKYALMFKIWHSIMGALLLYVTYSALKFGPDDRRFLIALLPYLLYYLFFLIGEIYRQKRDPFVEIGHAFFSHIYIILPFAFLLMMTNPEALRAVVPEDQSLGFPRTFWLLPVFTFVWLNDTGAYIIGSLFGKHKLLERVSPKKTIEGTIGGVILTLAGAIGFYYIFPMVTTLANWITLAIIVSIFSTWGDLFESFLKRTYGVKDSGKILPGHGGILDRVDSILIAALPAYLYISLVVNAPL
ncbi:phosphatidate cytidylyltransferase [Porphyromonadaceae bacterium W3.11]|nr:phosphatidate cytidylyltransferase [Porphyromonadaceae bacterium W3.11]